MYIKDWKQVLLKPAPKIKKGNKAYNQVYLRSQSQLLRQPRASANSPPLNPHQCLQHLPKCASCWKLSTWLKSVLIC